jgi:hypothetical protein
VRGEKKKDPTNVARPLFRGLVPVVTATQGIAQRCAWAARLAGHPIRNGADGDEGP